VGDNTATRFLNGEFSNQEVADLMRLANLQTEQMNAEAVVEAWRTAGQFIPGVGVGVALAEGDGIRGSAYFVRDVVLTVTATKLLQGGKTLAGMTLRGAGLGAMQGGTSAAFDIGAARAEAAWNGETYAGTVNGDAWEMFRATRNGAAFGLVLGPATRIATLRSSNLSGVLSRSQIIARADDALLPLANRFPGAKVGFRGSLARGTKGRHKRGDPFDPSNYDVDAFVVSDDLAALVPKNADGFRNLARLTEHRGLVGRVAEQIKAIPGVRQGDTFKVRVYSEAEFRSIVGLDEIHFLTH
jgi:filamentous hemagglutinin